MIRMRTGNNPIYSILISNYNNGHFLKTAIESALGQTYKNLEVVVVDDGSTDNSRDVINTFAKDPRIKIHLLEKNQGQGYVKKTLIDLSHGAYFAYLDADDALAQDAVETMVAYHVQNPKASLIYSQCYLCDENLLPKWVWERNQPIPDGLSYLHHGQYAVFHMASVNRSFFDQTEGMNPNDKRAMDQDLFYKLEEVGDLIFIEKPLYYYRRHASALTNSKNQLESLVWHLKYMQNACIRRGIEDEYFILASKLLQEREDGIKKRLKKRKGLRHKFAKFIINALDRFKNTTHHL